MSPQFDSTRLDVSAQSAGGGIAGCGRDDPSLARPLFSVRNDDATAVLLRDNDHAMRSALNDVGTVRAGHAVGLHKSAISRFLGDDYRLCRRQFLSLLAGLRLRLVSDDERDLRLDPEMYRYLLRRHLGEVDDAVASSGERVSLDARELAVLVAMARRGVDAIERAAEQCAVQAAAPGGAA